MVSRPKFTGSTFLLTRLLRGVTTGAMAAFKAGSISTHTPLARRDRKEYDMKRKPTISTHTPLARRDVQIVGNGRAGNDFYSHASCEA